MNVILTYIYTHTSNVRYDTNPTPSPLPMSWLPFSCIQTPSPTHTPPPNPDRCIPPFPTITRPTDLKHFHRGYWEQNWHMSKGGLQPRYGQATPSCRSPQLCAVFQVWLQVSSSFLLFDFTFSSSLCRSPPCPFYGDAPHQVCLRTSGNGDV